jgi:hypothetical protein
MAKSCIAAGSHNYEARGTKRASKHNYKVSKLHGLHQIYLN